MPRTPAQGMTHRYWYRCALSRRWCPIATFERVSDGRGLDVEHAAVGLHDLARDRQAEAGTAGPVGDGVRRLPERLKDPRDVVRGHATPGVADRDPHVGHVADRLPCHGDPHAALGR